jgi:hypothetical protein
VNRASRSSAHKDPPGHSVPQVLLDQLDLLAFRAPPDHREIQGRTDKMDKMDLLGQLALQALEARMA